MMITTDKMKEAIALKAEGMSGRKIAEKLGLSWPTVYRWLRQAREAGQPKQRDTLTYPERAIFDDLQKKGLDPQRNVSTIYQSGIPDFSTHGGDIEAKTVEITDNQIRGFKDKKIKLALVLVSSKRKKVVSEPLYIDFDAFKMIE